MSSLLKEATDNLSIILVSTRKIQSDIQEGFYPGISASDQNLSFQTINIPTIITTFNNEEDDKTKLLAFDYLAGVRFVKNTGEKKDSDNEKLDPVFSLSITFTAFYVANKDISRKALEEFHKKNVPYHVMPYWRKSLQTTLAEMNLPMVSIPFFFVEPENVKNENNNI